MVLKNLSFTNSKGNLDILENKFIIFFDKFWQYIYLDGYCITECLGWSGSVSVNNCKPESVKLSLEAMPNVTNGQNSCTGWAITCIKDQLK
jgi:hypothetical protein